MRFPDSDVVCNMYHHSHWFRMPFVVPFTMEHGLKIVSDSHSIVPLPAVYCLQALSNTVTNSTQRVDSQLLIKLKAMLMTISGS